MKLSRLVYDLNDPDFHGEWALEQYHDLAKNFAQQINYNFVDDIGKFTFILSEKGCKENNIEIRGFNLRGSIPVKLGQVSIIAASFGNFKVVYDSDSINAEKLTESLTEAYNIIKNISPENKHVDREDYNKINIKSEIRKNILNYENGSIAISSKLVIHPDVTVQDFLDQIKNNKLDYLECIGRFYIDVGQIHYVFFFDDGVLIWVNISIVFAHRIPDNVNINYLEEVIGDKITDRKRIFAWGKVSIIGDLLDGYHSCFVQYRNLGNCICISGSEA